MTSGDPLFVRIYMPSLVKSDSSLVHSKITTERRNYVKCESPNIVSFHSASSEVDLVYDQTTSLTIGYLATEYCTLAHLTDCAMLGDLMPEPTLRYVIKSIISGIKAIHSQRMAHRNLKLDHIYVDNNGAVKIGGLKYAGYEGELTTHEIESNYAAPEILADSCSC